MTTCPTCGKEAPPGSEACPACGASLQASESSKSDRPNTTVPGSPLPEAMGRREPEAAGAVLMSAKGRADLRKSYAPEGSVIDHKYAILRVLGEGGMGVVYLARDIHTGVEVVLKAVRSELAHRKDVRERTLAEGRALAQIDHPNVVHLKAVVVEDQALWLVMQYIEGESLEKTIRRHIDEKKPMPVPEVLRIFRQIVAGIDAAHLEGVIHRDLKPANVLLRRKDGVAKVTDFGIAKIEEDARAGKGMTKGIIGSLWYMSPEQVSGRRDLDKRVDVYALGIVLYEMLVGRVPFDADDDHTIMRMHLSAPVPLVSKMRRDVPESVDAIIQKACSKRREDRFASCDGILRALDAIDGSHAEGRSAGHAEASSHAAQPAQQPPAVKPPPTAPATTAPELDEAAAKAKAKAATEADDDATAEEKSSAKPSAAKAIAPTDAEGAPAINLPATQSADPAPPKRRRGWLIPIGAVVVLGGGAAAVFALGLIPGFSMKKPEPRARVDAAPVASSKPAAPPTGAPLTASSPVPSPTPPAPPPNPFVGLSGRWIGNGRDLEAVVSGDELEFRVVDPAQFETQGYEKGEARFALRQIPNEARVFAVEDRVRPIPPGDGYDLAKARGTCLEIWTEADKQPLRATFDGARLTVEFAKIEPTEANFTVSKGKVTSCIGLRKLKASKVVSSLERAK